MILANNVLQIWAETCQNSELTWYLYGETLLTAHTYHTLPDTLTTVQVAVYAGDLPRFCEEIFPKLPQDWQLDHKAFATNRRRLRFQIGEETVLALSVLCGASDEEAAINFSAELRNLREKQKKKIMLSLTPTAKAKKAFEKTVAFVATTGAKTPNYTDCATKKAPRILQGQWFEETQTIDCNGSEYPVFSGYRSYLELEYGDYENGMTDEVGVGLSAEEKQELKEHQKHCKAALTFVEHLSKKYGLRYYLLAGSVLGAVRHGGFIPWDDDVDIGIRVEDIEQFEELTAANLPEGFTFEQSAPNHPYPRMFSKICYDGRCCIDFWPLVPTYENGFWAKITWIAAKLLTKTHYLKIGHKVGKYRKLAKIAGFFLTDGMVMGLARWNERKFGRKKTPAYINLYSIYKREKETIKREWLDTEATAEFEGLTVPVVGCTDEYLTHLYGDYMQFPPPWKRASRHSARFGMYAEQEHEE